MRKADNLPPSCTVVTKSRNLNFMEPSGPLRACNGTDLPFLSLFRTFCSNLKQSSFLSNLPLCQRILRITHTVEHNYISLSSKNTTTCFGPICGPSSGCDLTYRAPIQDVWGVFEGVGDWGKRDLVVSIVGTMT